MVELCSGLEAMLDEAEDSDCITKTRPTSLIIFIDCVPAGAETKTKSVQILTGVRRAGRTQSALPKLQDLSDITS